MRLVDKTRIFAMMPRTMFILLLCVMTVPKTEAGIGFPFHCTVIGCGYCGTPRMQQVCTVFCAECSKINPRGVEGNDPTEQPIRIPVGTHFPIIRATSPPIKTTTVVPIPAKPVEAPPVEKERQQQNQQPPQPVDDSETEYDDTGGGFGDPFQGQLFGASFLSELPETVPLPPPSIVNQEPPVEYEDIEDGGLGGNHFAGQLFGPSFLSELPESVPLFGEPPLKLNTGASKARRPTLPQGPRKIRRIPSHFAIKLPPDEPTVEERWWRPSLNNADDTWDPTISFSQNRQRNSQIWPFSHHRIVRARLGAKPRAVWRNSSAGRPPHLRIKAAQPVRLPSRARPSIGRDVSRAKVPIIRRRVPATNRESLTFKQPPKQEQGPYDSRNNRWNAARRNQDLYDRQNYGPNRWRPNSNQNNRYENFSDLNNPSHRPDRSRNRETENYSVGASIPIVSRGPDRKRIRERRIYPAETPTPVVTLRPIARQRSFGGDINVRRRNRAYRKYPVRRTPATKPLRKITPTTPKPRTTPQPLKPITTKPPPPPPLAPPQSTSPQCPKPDWTPCVAKNEADKRFKKCCMEENFPEGCNAICRYGVQRPELEKVFMWQRSCPIDHIPTYMYCASGGHDAVPCCKEKGVLNGNRDLCTPFCNPAGGVPAFSLGFLKCLNQLDTIMTCYHGVLLP